MGKSTATGNVTAEEYTEPTVVRDALGRDHIVGPMSNMDEVEQKRRELDDAAKTEQPAEAEAPKPAADKPAEAPKSTGTNSTTTSARSTGK